MNKLEKQFKEQVELHGDKVAKAYEKACELSEKYGIPFGSYIPKSFHAMYESYEGPPPNYDYVYIGPRFVDKVCAMDNEWLSSTVECEFSNGGY